MPIKRKYLDLIIPIFLLTQNFIFSQIPLINKQNIEIIKSSNLTKKQIIESAKSKGFSDAEINSAIQKNSPNSIGFENNNDSKTNLNRLEKTDSKTMSDRSILNSSNTINSNENDLSIIEDSKLEIVEENINIESSVQTISNVDKYFGYDIFNSDPSLFQATLVGAADPDYLIGPGDEIIVMLWGETQFRQVLTVDREGFVFIPEIGQVFVNGLNLNLLESKLFRVLSQSYSSLNPQNRKATTFLDVSLGNLRPLRIQVLGEVSQPGAYTVSPSATLFSSLYYFKGPTSLGSLRNIKLIRNAKEIGVIDFYDYLLTGKKAKDIKLQLDDVIFIPTRLKTVSIQGEVNRPGIYELKQDETLRDILEIAGGLKVTAYLERTQIDRIVPFKKRLELGMDRMFIDVDLNKIISSDTTLNLEDGDRIEIFSVLELRQNVVEISGSVTRPGIYDLGNSLNLKQLIINADSLLGDVYLDRIDVVRIKPDFTEELIKLDLKEVLKENPEHNISLNGLDRIRVYGMTEMVPKKYVSISGHVKQPGRYLLQENMTVYDLIFKSGGYIDAEYKKLTYLKRAELIRVKDGFDEKEIIPFDLDLVLKEKEIAFTLLRPDDAIRIYSLAEIEGETRYVSIDGHVKRPGRYELYEKNMTAYDLLFRAGGYEDIIFKRNTFLDRADLIRYDKDRINQEIINFNLGEVLNDKTSISNFKLKPDDQIRVYSKAVFNNVKTVYIDGAIRNIGFYDFKKNMSVKDLILEAGGLKENTYRYILEIGRVDPENLNAKSYAEMITLNMDGDYSISKSNIDGNLKADDKATKDFTLMPFDYVSIRPDPYFSMQKKVEVLGEVNYPGVYVLNGPEEDIYDIIARAGGVRENAFISGARFTRNNNSVRIRLDKILKKKKSKYNVFLLPNDKIEIPSKPNTIQIVGEVNVPGYYLYIPGLRVKELINKAGGLSPDALSSNIYLTLSNGRSKKYNRWLKNPKVLDGSVLFVGKKPEEDPLDKTEFLKETTSILANLVQAISLILLAK